jgi:hypothetical protein
MCVQYMYRKRLHTIVGLELGWTKLLIFERFRRLHVLLSCFLSTEIVYRLLRYLYWSGFFRDTALLVTGSIDMDIAVIIGENIESANTREYKPSS